PRCSNSSEARRRISSSTLIGMGATCFRDSGAAVVSPLPGRVAAVGSVTSGMVATLVSAVTSLVRELPLRGFFALGISYTPWQIRMDELSTNTAATTYEGLPRVMRMSDYDNPNSCECLNSGEKNRAGRFNI